MIRVTVIDRSGKTSLWSDSMVGDGRILDRPRASFIEPHPATNEWVIRLSDHARNGRFAGLYVSGVSTASSNPLEALAFARYADAVKTEIDFISRNILLEGVKCQG